MALLGHPSAALRRPEDRVVVVDELAGVLDRTRPRSVLTHDLADRHTTHLAVTLAVIDAIRRLPAEDRPERLVGCEGWRSADWLAPEDLVRLDVTGHEVLAQDLLACFDSQLGPKAYPLATTGRRRANATFEDPRAPDATTEVVLAMDLTPLVADDGLDPAELLAAAVGRFAVEATTRLRSVLDPGSTG